MLTTATDLDYPAPGLDLMFNRTDLQPIDGRLRLGRLGRGWVDNWDISVTTDAQGNAYVEDAGVVRFFAIQPDGSYQAEPGDHGTLTSTGSGLILREANGQVEAFRPDGSLDYIQNANGNRITAGYTGSRLTTLTSSDGQSLTLGYDAQGRITRVTDPGGNVVTYADDPSDQYLVSATTHKGTTQYAYGAGQTPALASALTTVTNPDGTHVYYTYDAQGRLIGQSLDGGAQPLTYSYGRFGGFTQTDVASESQTFLTDELGQVAQYIDPRGRTTHLSYDAQGNLVKSISPVGKTATYSYDSRGNLTSLTDPLGNHTELTYDPQFNQLTSYTDPRGNTTTYTIDAHGNVVASTDPAGDTATYSYNASGDLTGATDRRGQAIGYTYNPQGQVTSIDFADRTHVAYTYDPKTAQVTTATDASGPTTLQYDPVTGLPTKVTYPDGRFLSYTYNAGGRVTSTVDQDGFTTNYAYDAQGRLSALTDGSGATIVSYSYNPVDLLSREDHGNGTYTTYQYDADGSLIHEVNHAPDGSVNSQLDDTYNADGKLTSETTADGTTSYGYDADGQLTSVTLPGGRTMTYAYDPSGNRVSVTDNGVATPYTVNNLNEYTSVGGTTYGYDADGNLTSSTANGVTTTYTYDALNRLTGISAPGDTYTYQYAALGHLAMTTHKGQRTENLVNPLILDGVLPQPGLSGRVVFNPLVATGSGLQGVGLLNSLGHGDVVAQYGPNGQITHFTYGLGLVSLVSGSGQSYYYDFDGGGSTIGLTGSIGSYVDRYTYLPFGVTTTITAAIANPFTFVGQFGVSTDGSGLINMHFRNYDPTTGQFVSNDPIGLLGVDANLRRYVGNSPTDQIDPSGLVDPSGPMSFPEFVQWLTGFTIDQIKDVFPSSSDFDRAMNVFEQAYIRGGRGMEPPPLSGGPPPRPPLIGPPPLSGPKLPGPPRFGPPSPILLLLYLPEISAVSDWAGQQLRRFKPVVDFDNKLAKLIGSADPNDLSGPAGFGPQGFLTPDRTLPYRVDFENIPTATAPRRRWSSPRRSTRTLTGPPSSSATSPSATPSSTSHRAATRTAPGSTTGRTAACSSTSLPASTTPPDW